MTELEHDERQEQAAEKQLRNQMHVMGKDRGVVIGFPEHARYDRGRNKMPVAAVAAILELGSTNPSGPLPPRPFMRYAADQSRKDIDKLMRGYEKDPEKTLNLVGMTGVAAVQKSITEGPWAPLADSTVAGRRRGLDGLRSSKPLVDTGYLRASVTYVVFEVDQLPEEE